jgi:cell division septation protein DedD
MAREEGNEPVREFRLEGLGLVLIGGVLIAALAGAFFVGRWYERQTLGPAAARALAEGDPLANVVRTVEEAPADVDSDAGYFDRVQGDEQELEPQRETQRAPAEGGQPAPAAPARATTPGDFWVQVFAGRAESAAAGLVQKLEAAGQPVKLHTEREGDGSLYKVRVGGFTSIEEARAAARRLQGQGYAGAWVTREP